MASTKLCTEEGTYSNRPDGSYKEAPRSDSPGSSDGTNDRSGDDPVILMQRSEESKAEESSAEDAHGTDQTSTQPASEGQENEHAQGEALKVGSSNVDAPSQHKRRRIDDSSNASTASTPPGNADLTGENIEPLSHLGYTSDPEWHEVAAPEESDQAGVPRDWKMSRASLYLWKKNRYMMEILSYWAAHAPTDEHRRGYQKQLFATWKNLDILQCMYVDLDEPESPSG
ncbi:MAG: hypothetical protein Q9188_004016 [Gyalolechia gomerana]